SRFQMLQEIPRDTVVALDCGSAVALLDQKSFEPQQPRFSTGNISRRASSHAPIYENNRALGLKLCEGKRRWLPSECSAEEFPEHIHFLRIISNFCLRQPSLSG